MSLSRGRGRRLADLPVAVRVGAIAAVGLLSTLAVGGIAVSISLSSKDSVASLYERDLLPSVAMGDVQTLFISTRLDMANLAAQPDPASRAKQYADFGKRDGQLDTALARYAELRPDRAVATAQLTDLVGRYRAIREQFLVPAVNAGNLPEYQKLRKEKVVPVSDELTALIGTEVDANATQAAEEQGAIAATLNRWLLVVAITVAVALAVALVLAIITIRSILRPLRAVAHVAAGLSQGDLTRRTGITSRDEFGRTAADLDASLAELSATVSSVSTASRDLRSASTSVGETARSIVAQAESSALDAQRVAAAGVQLDASVSTLAASGVQMGATIADVARAAASASTTAAGAADAAAAASETVVRLGQSSSQIAEVTALISTIASQTRLLALNATIESARAGEAGRGFAVVATEVKTLATETARASQEAQDRVEAITADVAAAINAIDTITHIINEIAETQSTIAAAVEEQSAVTQDSTAAVQQASDGASSIALDIAEVAQGSRATSDSGRALESVVVGLEHSSDELAGLVARFTL